MRKDTDNSRNVQAFREFFVLRLLKSIDCRIHTFLVSSAVMPVAFAISATERFISFRFRATDIAFVYSP